MITARLCSRCQVGVMDATIETNTVTWKCPNCGYVEVAYLVFRNGDLINDN